MLSAQELRAERGRKGWAQRLEPGGMVSGGAGVETEAGLVCVG